MGNRYSWRSGKFYWEQVKQLRDLLVRYVKEQASPVDLDKYLRICEQLGEEPDPQKMPLTQMDFPSEIQVAFFMYDLLSDVWEGMSGTYMGKDWSHCSQLFDIWDIEDARTVMYYMKVYERIIVQHRSEESDRQRKQSERKKGGEGKNYTHNVKG